MRKRGLSPDDLLEREELGQVELSPDGRWVAFVVKRPRLSARFHKHDFMDGCDRGDVWVADTSGGKPRNLTGGAGVGDGYWAPDWSPDGSRLAMLSTREGNVGLWVYELSSSTLTRASERAVDLLTVTHRSALWVSDERLLVAMLPEGERPSAMTVEIRPRRSPCANGQRRGTAKSPPGACSRAAPKQHSASARRASW